MNESELLLKEYLSTNQIIVVDSVSSARVNLTSQLCKLGAVRQKMILVASLEEAKLELERTKAKIVFADFLVGNTPSLELIQNQKEEYEKRKIKDTLFVLVTGNASQSVVARAAEEDVDSFIIKPYTFDLLKKSLFQTVNAKLNPSVYSKLIDEGKEFMFQMKLEAAAACFQKAMSENTQPTLACFYFGQVELMQSAMSSAEHKFEQGLGYNKIHYKCLIGLFELLSKENKFHEAYDVVKRVVQYFPANPKRLLSVLRLAIITENFQDMEGYYGIFKKIEQRNAELIKYMCSALVVTGKYYLRQKIRERALELFNGAVISAGPQVQFNVYVIENLIEFKMVNETKPFLDRLRQNGNCEKEVKIAEFIIASATEKPSELVNRGRQLLKEGCDSPSVYEKLILSALDGGYVDYYDELKVYALNKWPAMHKRFEFKSEKSA